MVAVGIDFGTTNSVASYVDPMHGTIVPLLDIREASPHPSVVWFSLDGVRVGHEARRNLNGLAEEPGHAFVSSIKMSLGQARMLDILGTPRPAYQVAAEIFKHLKRHARDRVGIEIEEAVVTIPIRFGGRARAEIRQAAREAGIEITTFVHEPFAAVVAHYYGLEQDISELPRQNLLVFDWGGGTLDITLTRLEEGRLVELATGGLDGIAGDHFDRRIRDWAIARFAEEHGVPTEAISIHPTTMDRFLAECERVKVALSTTEEELLEVPRLAMIGGRARGIRTTLTRGDLEALIDADIQHALVEVDGVLATARMSEREVGTALMIGGTSNVPLLRREMQRRFGTRAFTAEDAQTIIAEGAAAIAHNRHRPFLARPVQLLLVDGTPYEVFGKDTVVPLDTQRELTLFCTDPRDGEARLVVAEQTVEGDRGSIRQQTIVRVPVTRRIPPPGNNERLYASFGIDENLILKIEAYSASIQQIASEEIHDLAFGLRLT